MAAKKKTAKKKVSKKKVSKKKAIAKKSSAKPPVKINAKLSKKVTDFILLKTNITAATKQLEGMKSEASKLEEELMIDLAKINQLGVMVKAGSIKFAEKDVFNVKDWNKVYKHILKTKNFGFLQKRLSTALLNEIYEDTGKTIAGVEHFTKKSLSHSKAKE